MGCTPNAGKQEGKLVFTGKDVTFDMGFKFTARECCFEHEGKEYVAFANFITSKKICLFDMQGHKLKELLVKDLEEYIPPRIIAFDMVEPNRIALLSNQSNIVLLVDDNGKILAQKDYSYLLQEKGVVLYPPFRFDRQTVRAAIQYYDIEKLYKKDKKNITIRRFDFIIMICDTAFYSDAHPLLQMDLLYSRFVHSDNLMVSEGKNITMADDINVFSSAFSDSLYLYGLAGNLYRIVPIKSCYTNIGITPITYKQNEQDESLLNKKYREYGFVDKILWDKYHELYYCFVREPMNEGKLPFSIIVFDKDFNKPSETKINEDKYYLSVFLGREGLYLLRKTPEIFGKDTYSLFKYEQ